MSSRRHFTIATNEKKQQQHLTGTEADFERLRLPCAKYQRTNSSTLTRQDNTSKSLIRKKKLFLVQPKTTTRPETEWKHYHKTFAKELDSLHLVDCSICGEWGFDCKTRSGNEGARCKHWPRFLDEFLILIANEKTNFLIVKHFYQGFVKKIEENISPTFLKTMSSWPLVQYMGVLSVIENPLVFQDVKDIPFFLEEDDYREWRHCLSKSFSAFRWLREKNKDQIYSFLFTQIQRLEQIPICSVCYEIQIGLKQHYYEHFGEEVFQPLKEWLERVLDSLLIHVGDRVMFHDSKQPYEELEGKVVQINDEETQAKLKRTKDGSLTKWRNIRDLKKKKRC